MTQFCNRCKKPCFWLIFGAKKNFLENPALSLTTLYGFLAPCQNQEKVNDTVLRKHSDRQLEGWTEGRKDGQILFYRTLPATAGCPKMCRSYRQINYKDFERKIWNLD